METWQQNGVHKIINFIVMPLSDIIYSISWKSTTRTHTYVWKLWAHVVVAHTCKQRETNRYTHTHSCHTDNANTLCSQLNFYSTPQTKRIPAYLVRENESIFSYNFNWIDATEYSRAVYILYTLRVWITVDVALGFAWLVFWLWRNIGLTNWIDLRILSTKQISRCWKNTAQSCGWLSVHFFCHFTIHKQSFQTLK